jgi:hypothetical protein
MTKKENSEVLTDYGGIYKDSKLYIIPAFSAYKIIEPLNSVEYNWIVMGEFGEILYSYKNTPEELNTAVYFMMIFKSYVNPISYIPPDSFDFIFYCKNIPVIRDVLKLLEITGSYINEVNTFNRSFDVISKVLSLEDVTYLINVYNRAFECVKKTYISDEHKIEFLGKLLRVNIDKIEINKSKPLCFYYGLTSHDMQRTKESIIEKIDDIFNMFNVMSWGYNRVITNSFDKMKS